MDLQLSVKRKFQKMAASKNKKTVKRCVEMFTDEVSIVTRGANGHREFLMVKSENGDVGQIIVDDVEKVVPKKDADSDTKKKAQADRSKKYGIEILTKNSSLSYPSDAPTTERLYGDPVNLKYPLAYDGDTKPDPARTRNAIARFKQNYKEYSKKSSQSRIYERIVRAAMAADIDVSYDPDNPVDSLLPGGMKTRLQKNADGSDTDPESTETNTMEDDEITVEDWLDGISKTIDGQEQDEWMDVVQSSIDSVDGSQDEEGVNNSVDDDPGDPQDADDTNPHPVRKFDTSENNDVIETLKKESLSKDAKIESLEKSITSLKADLLRLSTSIGSAQSIQPGSSDVDDDPIDEINSSIDLSPALSE